MNLLQGTAYALAQHLKQVCFGGNWTTSSLQDHLPDILWHEAIQQVNGYNTLAALTWHIHYYMIAIYGVLQNKGLHAHDKYSYQHPPLPDEEHWQQLLDQVWQQARILIQAMESFPDKELQHPFTDEKYGTYLRNFLGLIEHTHYHLGQIVLIKKMIRNNPM